MTRYAKTAPPLRIRWPRTPRQPKFARQARVHAANRRLSAEELSQLAADYRAGRSTTWLMQTYNLGKGTVLNLLAEQGVEMRGQGIDGRLEEVIQLYHSGLSLKAIAARLGCSAEPVRQALTGAGVPLRKPWERGQVKRRSTAPGTEVR